MRGIIKVGFFACVCLGIIICALYAPLQVRFYTLTSPKIHSNIKIALLSDLHSGRFYQEQIFATLATQNPDMILMAGDMVDDKEDIQGAIEFFARLNQPPFDKIPKYYVSGNHEFWSSAIIPIKQMIQAHHTIVLDRAHAAVHTSIKDNALIIAGIDDPYVVKYDDNGHRIQKTSQEWGDWQGQWSNQVLQTFEALDLTARQEILDSQISPTSPISSKQSAYPQTLQILLSHRPECIKLFNQLDFDLIVSGHTHGGQVRIPFILNGLYAPNQGIFPQYVGGLYTLKDNQTLVVSRGLSLNVFLPRVFNPPEVVMIMLEPQG